MKKISYETIDDYQLIKRLGEGANGEVYLAFDHMNNKQVAIKMLKERPMSQDNIQASEKKKLQIQELNMEFKLLKNLEHPFIIKAYDFKFNGKYVTKDLKESERVYIVLELAQNSEMFEYIAQTRPFGEATGRYFFLQLIDAIQYCFNQGICHRDLKPQNIVFDENFNCK